MAKQGILCPVESRDAEGRRSKIDREAEGERRYFEVNLFLIICVMSHKFVDQEIETLFDLRCYFCICFRGYLKSFGF